MISDIVIEELHGLYDYNIHFPENQRVCIITGPNGYGKTTILKIINHVLYCKFWFFFFIEFKKISLKFTNGRILDIERINSAESDTEDSSEIVSVKEKIQIKLFIPEEENPIEMLTIGSQYLIRQMKRYGRGYTLFADNNSKLEYTLEKYYKPEDDSYIAENGKNIQLFLQEQKCIYVQEQRLMSDYTYETPKYVFDNGANSINIPEINVIATELKRKFADVLKDFVTKSQEIDATFIKRLIDNQKEAYCEKEFQTKLNNLKEKIDKLQKYGLSPKINIPQGYLKDFQVVLSLYIDDMEAKMSVFDEFYKQLEIFDRVVSGKSLSNKKIIFNDKDGIKFVNDKDKEIPLSKLSSGEQNLIILYYKLIFSLKKDTLLLIDEPENSLHVAWLTKMLDDYLEMAQKLQCQIIIATHSTTFINGEWDMTVDLYENNSK